MTYQELANLLREHERSGPKTHLTAYITFSSFGPHNENTYPWEGRTYVISSNNKAFQPNKSGYSIFGSCLDGSDPYIRLDKYMQAEHGGEDGWTVEDCCIINYLLSGLSDGGMSMPKIFSSYETAYEHMLFQLAQAAEVNFEYLKTEALLHAGVVENEQYEIHKDSAWLLDKEAEDGMWQIKIVRIYSPLRILFGHE